MNRSELTRNDREVNRNSWSTGYEILCVISVIIFMEENFQVKQLHRNSVDICSNGAFSILNLLYEWWIWFCSGYKQKWFESFHFIRKQLNRCLNENIRVMWIQGTPIVSIHHMVRDHILRYWFYMKSFTKICSFGLQPSSLGPETSATKLELWSFWHWHISTGPTPITKSTKVD